MAIRVAAQVLLIHIALILFGAAKAFAWGDDGHRIVCEIAFQLLDEAHRKEVITLTDAYRRPNNGAGFSQFTESCLFADEARQKARQKTPGWQKFEPFDRWHFLNVSRATPLIAESDCHKNCVLFAITHHIDNLKAAERVDRAEALFFLSHWLGDIHQPVHMS